MNDYARGYLRIRDSRRGRDGRNPYGSRGGYVDSRSDYRGRDRADMRGRNDMRYGNDYRDRNDYAEYDSRQDYRDYAEHDIQSDYRDYEQHGQYNRDYEDMRSGRSNYRPIEAMGYFNGYYDMGGQDYYSGRDGHNKLSKKDIKKWEKSLENADGTKGKKYDVEQIEKVAQQNGVRFNEYSPELFTMVVNMMYSDYCKVLGSDMMIYVRLAKAFLEDDDFDGEPEEKVMLYYKCIVEKDEE
jgi:hypothetical protein